jgi:hypothetical protein
VAYVGFDSDSKQWLLLAIGNFVHTDCHDSQLQLVNATQDHLPSFTNSLAARCVSDLQCALLVHRHKMYDLACLFLRLDEVLQAYGQLYLL